MSQIRKFKSGGAHLMIDEHPYEMNEENLQDLYNDIMQESDSELKLHLLNVYKDLSDGKDRRIDTIPNQISGSGILDRYSEQDANNIRNKTNGRWNATVNNTAHQFNSAVAWLGNWRPKNEKSSSSSDNSKKTKIYGDAGSFVYDKDDAGNLIFSADNFDNASHLKRIKNVLDYYGSDEEGRNNYEFDSNYTDRIKDSLSDWYGASDRTGYYDALLGRISSNTLTSDDKSFLKAIGLSSDGTESAKEKEDPKWATVKNWKGNEELLKKHNIILGFDDDGRLTVSGDNRFAGSNWYNKGLDWLNGTGYENGAIIDGKLYTLDEIRSGKYQNVTDKLMPFINRDNKQSWNDWYAQALASGIHFASEGRNPFKDVFNASESYNSDWSRGFDEHGLRGTYNVADMTGGYGNIGNYKILAYMDPSNRDDFYGIINPKFMVRDENGNYHHYNSEDEMLLSHGFTRNTDPFGFGSSEFATSDYGQVGRKGEMAVMGDIVINNQTTTILRGRDGHLYLKVGDKRARRIYDEQTALDMLQNPNKYKNGNLAALMKKRNTTVAKHQFGGPLLQANTQVISGPTVDQATSSYSKAHALDGSDGGLTDWEKTKLAAAVTDLLGVGTSFVNGVAGAAVGAAGSTANFVADIKRDGFQGRDLGNYAMMLGLDIATATPLLGKIASGAKAAKVIKTVGQPLMKMLALSGAAAPVMTAVSRIANGEKYTSEDLATAIRGIGSAAIASNLIKQKGQDLANIKANRSSLTDAASAKKAALLEKHGITSEEFAGFAGMSKKELTAQLKRKNMSDDDIKSFFKDAGIKFNRDGSWKDMISRTEKEVPSIVKKFEGFDEGTISHENISGFNGKTKSEVQTELRKMFKSSDGTEKTLSDEQLNELLNTMQQRGLKYNTKKDKFEFNAKKELSIADKTAAFEDKFKDHSMFRYWADPFARYNATEQIAGTLDPKALEAAVKAFAKGKATAAQKSIARMTAENPHAFGDKLLTKKGVPKKVKTIEPEWKKPRTWLSWNRNYRPYTAPKTKASEKQEQPLLLLPAPSTSVQNIREQPLLLLPASKESMSSIQKPLSLPAAQERLMIEGPKPWRTAANEMEDFRGTPKSSIDNNSASESEKLLAVGKKRRAAKNKSKSKEQHPRTAEILKRLQKQAKQTAVLNPQSPTDAFLAELAYKEALRSLVPIQTTYKRGGILKAQTGGYVDWTQGDANWTDDEKALRYGVLGPEDRARLMELMQKQQRKDIMSPAEDAELARLISARNSNVSTLASPIAKSVNDIMSKYTETVEDEDLPDDPELKAIKGQLYTSDPTYKSIVDNPTNTQTAGNPVGDPYEFKYARDLRSLGRLAIGNRYLNKAAADYKRAIRAAGNATTGNVAEIYDRYSDAGVGSNYEEAIAKHLQEGPAQSADSKLNRITNLTKNLQALTMRGEKTRELSKMWQENLLKHAENSRNYAANRALVADKNRTLAAKIDSQLAEADSAVTNARYANLINPYLTEMETRIQREEDSAEALKQSVINSNIAQQAENIKNKKLMSYRKEWLKSDAYKNNVDFDDYMQTDPDRFAAYEHAINDAAYWVGQQRVRTEGNNYKYGNHGVTNMKITPVYYSKNGGSTSTYQKRETLDVMAIDLQKAASRAVAEMDKSLLRRLEKIFD